MPKRRLWGKDVLVWSMSGTDLCPRSIPHDDMLDLQYPRMGFCWGEVLLEAIKFR